MKAQGLLLFPNQALSFGRHLRCSSLAAQQQDVYYHLIFRAELSTKAEISRAREPEVMDAHGEVAHLGREVDEQGRPLQGISPRWLGAGGGTHTRHFRL